MSKKILKSSLTIMLVVVVFSSSIYAKEIKTAEELYNEADVLRCNGIIIDNEEIRDIKKAIKKYKEIVKKYPKTIWAAKAQMKIGNCYGDFKKYYKSVFAASQRALSHIVIHYEEPDDYNAQLARLNSRREQKAYDKAIIMFQELGDSGQFALAEYYYVEAKDQAESKYKDFWGTTIDKTTCWSKVVEAYKKVGDKFPESKYAAESLHKIGLIYDDYLNKTAEKLKIDQQLVNNYPGSEYADDAQFSIARTYEKRKDYNQAIGEYLKLINNYPDSEHISEARKNVSSTINTALSISDLRNFVKERPKSEFVTEAEARISYFVQKEKEETRAREEVERRRAETERGRTKQQEITKPYNSAKREWDYLYQNEESIITKLEEHWVSWDLFVEKEETDIEAFTIDHCYLYCKDAKERDLSRKVIVITSCIDLKNLKMKPRPDLTFGNIIHVKGLFTAINHKGPGLIISCQTTDIVRLK